MLLKLGKKNINYINNGLTWKVDTSIIIMIRINYCLCVDEHVSLEVENLKQNIIILLLLIIIYDKYKFLIYYR